MLTTITNFSHSPLPLAQRLFFIFLISLLAFSVPTAWAEKLVAPKFSHESGFYPEEFKLKLTHPERGVNIYYTLDGSDPDPENIAGSTYQYKNGYAQPPAKPSGKLVDVTYQTHVYQTPIPIEDRSQQPDRLAVISTTSDKHPDYFPGEELDTWENKAIYQINRVIYQVNRIIKEINRSLKKINDSEGSWYIGLLNPLKIQKEALPMYKGTAVRALAVDPNKNNSDVVSKVFFIGDSNDFSLPVINITVPEKALFDYNEGVFVAGQDYDQWLLDVRAEKRGVQPDKSQANWLRRGDDIATNMHFLNTKDQINVEQSVNIRVHGGGSRSLPNKSIRVYPSTILRNAGQHNSHTYLADAAIQRAMTGLNVGLQRYEPMVVFINAEYYGILNARDRHNKHYLAENYNLPSKKVDLLDSNQIVKQGDTEHWNKTQQFIVNTSKDSELFFSELEKQIDVNSFIDYQSTEIFLANADWPHNNIRYWRYRGSNKHPITQQGFTDGRWRWLLYDLDHTGGGIAKYKSSHNSLAAATDSASGWSTFMLRTLLENPEFKEHFITRFSDLLNSTFKSERMANIIRDTETGIETEMPRHIERWGAPKSMKFWRESVDSLARFFDMRPAYQWQHLQKFFELNAPYSLQVDISQKKTGKVKINTLTIGDSPDQEHAVTDTPLLFPWNGQYFQDLPITIEALPEAGYEFSHWEIAGQNLTEEQKKQKKLILKPQNNLQLKAVMLSLM